MKIEKLYKNKGITLLALVITMVILVILATVTISAAIGDNGLIKKADETKDMATNSLAGESEKLNQLVQEYANMMSEDGEIPPPEEDKIPPTVTITTGTITKNSIAVTVNATDTGSGLATSGTYKYYLNGEEKITNERNTYTFTGLTAGTEYIIKVEVFDKAGNKGENSVTASTEEKPGVDAGEISQNPTVFYGSEVQGYTCASQGVSKWRIFYADSTNIYLIADEYISYKDAPNGKNGTPVTTFSSGYEISFKDVYRDYEGASWINSNSKGKKWLNQYLISNPSSTSGNIRAAAYMMDTNVWSVYAGEDAEYAMGGSTIELYSASYKDTHPNKYIEYQAFSGTGYKVKWSTDSGYNTKIEGIPQNEFNKIYRDSDDSKANAMWLASPEAGVGTAPANMLCVYYDGRLYSTNGTPGLRPIVCLKSEIRIKQSK